MSPRLLVVLSFAALLGCPEKKDPPPPPPPGVNRCEVDLAASGLFSDVGTSARARIIGSPEELIGGQSATGTVGDVLLENDRIRVVIEKASRHIGPQPFGGNIIDADLKRDGAGADQFGEIGLIYSFGRTSSGEFVEVLDSGEQGGTAVVAVTGKDEVNDFIHLKRMIHEFVGDNLQLVLDPDEALPLRMTTYYVLSPGENRVRVLTAFCNDGNTRVATEVGDLIDSGGTIEFFNPRGCSNALGARACQVDPTAWFGYQGESVAYGYRSYSLANPAQLGPPDALLTTHGIAATLAGGENVNGLLSWLDNQSQKKGFFAIPEGGQKLFLRDFVVARDLAEIHSGFLVQDDVGRARILAKVERPDGSPAAGARIAVVSDAKNRMVSLMVTRADGTAHIDVEPGSYKLTAGIPDYGTESTSTVSVPSSGDVSATLRLPEARTLTVTVQDPAGSPIPARVTLKCAGGACPVPNTQLRDLETLPSEIFTLGFVPPHGTLAISVVPGEYELIVTRGPEWSAHPETFPNGEPIDLRTADQSRTVMLGRVVDTTGWASGDLHVHAQASADSSLAHDRRVLTFLAEGVDVLVSTDHDVITDFSPAIQALGAQSHLTSIVGEEITPFDFGHFNAFPVTRGEGPNGGAFDWAGGVGPTLRLDELFTGLQERFPGSLVQINHARSAQGTFNLLRLDTLTGATHEDPTLHRMAPHPEASAADTRLFDARFDLMEVQNGLRAKNSLLNDWMTFLSRGLVKTATSVSDSHHVLASMAGYGRSYVRVDGDDAPAALSHASYIDGLKRGRVSGTNGPFVRVTAQRLDGAGAPTGAVFEVGDTLSVPAGEKFQLTVDVQTPEWMQFDRIEFFTHADGREAFDGKPNDTWPDTRRLAQIVVQPDDRVIEAVPGPGSLRRVRVVKTQEITADKDAWFVVIVRGTTASRPLYPLTWDEVKCDGRCTAQLDYAYAFTNPIFVDADGTGAYDRFPIMGPRSLPLPPEPIAPERRSFSVEELQELIQRAKSHD